MKKRVSKYKKEYMKERRRVQRLVNRYKKIGYEVNIKIPKIPKRITSASIRRLEKITADKVSRETFLPDPSTGEVTRLYKLRGKGFSLRKLEKLTAPGNVVMQPNVSRETLIENLVNTLSDYAATIQTDYPAYSEIVISNFIDEISEFPDVTRDIIMNWFNALRDSTNDDDKIADMLQDAKERGIAPRLKDAYNTDMLLSNLTEMFNLLDISAGEKSQIINDLDFDIGIDYGTF